MTTRTISLELNELNFHYVIGYAAAGKLPHFARLLDECALVTTRAERGYPFLEPWIQWPTVYSGLGYDEHRLFRLGDVIGSGHRQIWEYLEARGLKVGAVSPMNAANRCVAPDFFLPDPWTNTAITAEPRVKALFELIARVVNSNATEPVSFVKTGRRLLPLALPYLAPGSWPHYARILRKAIGYQWAKAAFLDRLLADLFIALVRRNRTDYASLFLNAGAHIQHHHTYDSSAYDGERSNPAWYSRAAESDEDPLLFIYQTYDAILADMLALEDTRVIITTGLSQMPNEREHYQYRPRDFARFLADVGLPGVKCEPRMSRDFLLSFGSRPEVEHAIATLGRVTAEGKPFFTVEDRGESLFCQVACYGPPASLKAITIDGAVTGLSDNLALVSIENGIHQTTGYYIDSAIPRGVGPSEIPLTDVFDRLCQAALANREPLRGAA